MRWYQKVPGMVQKKSIGITYLNLVIISLWNSPLGNLHCDHNGSSTPQKHHGSLLLEGWPVILILDCVRVVPLWHQFHFEEQGEVTGRKVNLNFIAYDDPRDESWVIISHLMKLKHMLRCLLLLIVCQGTDFTATWCMFRFSMRNPWQTP